MKRIGVGLAVLFWVGVAVAVRSSLRAVRHAEEARERQRRDEARRAEEAAARARNAALLAAEAERHAFEALDARGHLVAALEALGPPANGDRGAALALRHLDAMRDASPLDERRSRQVRAEAVRRRTAAEREHASLLRELGTRRRDQFASQVFNALIQDRRRVERVLARGPDHTTLWVEWVMCDHVTVADLSRLDGLRAAGFTRIECERPYTHRVYSIDLPPIQ